MICRRFCRNGFRPCTPAGGRSAPVDLPAVSFASSPGARVFTQSVAPSHCRTHVHCFTLKLDSVNGKRARSWDRAAATGARPNAISGGVWGGRCASPTGGVGGSAHHIQTTGGTRRPAKRARAQFVSWERGGSARTPTTSGSGRPAEAARAQLVRLTHNAIRGWREWQPISGGVWGKTTRLPRRQWTPSSACRTSRSRFVVGQEGCFGGCE
jgi:hypothetical protein